VGSEKFFEIFLPALAGLDWSLASSLLDQLVVKTNGEPTHGAGPRRTPSSLPKNPAKRIPVAGYLPNSPGLD
jgi:hypothetical protein